MPDPRYKDYDERPKKTMELILTGGHIVLYDRQDHEMISKYKWNYHNDGYCYATVIGSPRAERKNVLMHRMIMNTPEGMDTDHRNRNRLDNRRSNLRITNRTQNNFNSPVRVDNKSGHKGVIWFKPASRWRAYIGGGKNRVELGYFKTIEEAIQARKEAELTTIIPAL